MKVKELIEELKKCGLDHIVFTTVGTPHEVDHVKMVIAENIVNIDLIAK